MKSKYPIKTKIQIKSCNETTVVKHRMIVRRNKQSAASTIPDQTNFQFSSKTRYYDGPNKNGWQYSLYSQQYRNEHPVYTAAI